MESYQKKTGAFFDVDETLISFKSMFNFLEYLTRKPEKIDSDFIKKIMYFRNLDVSNLSREEVNIKYYEIFSGIKISTIESLAIDWYENISLDKSHLFNRNVMLRLTEHLNNGLVVCLVSGSFDMLLQLFAESLGIRHLLCSKIETQDGYYTGKLINGPIIGEGKAKAITDFSQKYDIDLSRSYAYGDHYSDIPMLSTVGHPFIIEPKNDLMIECDRRGWKTLNRNN